MTKRSERHMSKGQARRQKNQSARPGSNNRWVIAAGIMLTAAAIAMMFLQNERRNEKLPVAVHSERRARPEYAVFRAPNYAKDHSFDNETVLVWGGDHQFTEGLRQNERIQQHSTQRLCRARIRAANATRRTTKTGPITRTVG